MNSRNAMLCTALALGTGFVSMPASARVYVDVDIAPPAVRTEVVPAPRVGYVWAPGYWDWLYHRHVWVGGHWVRARYGYHWVAPYWVQRGPRWHFEPGVWVRD